MLSPVILFGLLVSFSSTLVAFPYPPSPSTSPIKTIYEFPNETWVENLAVRSSGELLLTLITTPDLYQLDPFSPTEAILIHSFPNATSVLGISEIQPDVFAVVVGNWSDATFTTFNGSYSIWKVDLQSFQRNGIGKFVSKASVSKIASLPEASFLNGMTLLAPLSAYLLIADSGLGVVWRLNYLTGEYEIVLDNALMKSVPNPLGITLGINGVHTRNGDLYFTNSVQDLLARVPISATGTATGSYEVVAENGSGDDFAFDKQGNAYIAQDPGDALQQVTPAGKVTVLAGSTNSTILEGDTSAAFGRTWRDSDTLYVTTNGGIAGLVAGTNVVGGKVLAVDIPALLSQKQI
jgi:hypothetical protein